MKKQSSQLATLFLLLLFVGTVNAQTGKKESENIFGIIVGGTLSNISNYDATNRLGFMGGLYWEWKFSEDFSTMPSILYAERGATGKGDRSSIKLSYITIPIVLKYSLSETISIATGLAWDELLSVQADGLNSDDVRHDDWRIPITLGYHISDHLSLGLSYSFGLTDITKNDEETLRNNWGSIALAYLL